MFGTPAGAVLSPAAPELVGRALTELDVIEGYVVAQLDPSHVGMPRGDEQQGVVEAVAIAAAATEPMQVVASAQAIAGRGLAGDRYATQAGTFSSHSPSAKGYDLTLIEAEVLEGFVLADGQPLSFAGARRNVLTRGVDLNSLVGRRFLIGDVECLGQRLCEPCAHLQRLSGPGLLKPLIHRGGLRADILTDGEISAGATIHAAQDQRMPVSRS
jgi:MOSC domain-containing protein YiiM